MSESYLKFATAFPYPEKAAKEIVSLCDFFENLSTDGFAKHEWFFSNVDWDKDILEAIQKDPENIQYILYDAGINPPNLIAEWFPYNSVLYFASEKGSPEMTCEILKISMAHNDIKGSITFEAAVFSDRLQVNGFGGIACGVNQKGYVVEDTGLLCAELEARLEKADMEPAFK